MAYRTQKVRGITEAQANTWYLRLDGTNDPMTGDVTFDDGIKLHFGTGNEASIYYDATDFILETTSGDLYLSTPSVSMVSINYKLEVQERDVLRYVISMGGIC